MNLLPFSKGYDWVHLGDEPNGIFGDCPKTLHITSAGAANLRNASFKQRPQEEE